MQAVNLSILRACVCCTHRELCAAGGDVDSVLLLTDVPEARRSPSPAALVPVRRLPRTSLLCRLLCLSLLQGDTQGQVLGQVIHGGIGSGFDISEIGTGITLG